MCLLSILKSTALIVPTSWGIFLQRFEFCEFRTVKIQLDDLFPVIIFEAIGKIFYKWSL